MEATGNALTFHDPAKPYGIAFQHFYSVPEASQILNICGDLVRLHFKPLEPNGRMSAYGPILPIKSQVVRKHKRNYLTLRISYSALIAFIERGK